MNEILISFCIPVFNSELTIKKAVDNLLKLKSNNFEIVLYYDESSDRTIEIIQSFNSPYVRIVKNTSRKKYGRMMIDCIMAGSGKYVMYTIDRNLIAIDAMEKIISYIEDNEIGCGISEDIQNGKVFVHNSGIDAVLRIGYKQNHPVGNIYNRNLLFEALRTLNNIDYYNFPLDFINAYIASRSVCITYNHLYYKENFWSAIQSNSKSTQPKITEWYTPFGRIRFMNACIAHVKRLGLDKKDTNKLLKQLYEQTKIEGTVGYSNFLCDYTACKHYSIRPQYIDYFQLLFYKAIIYIDFYVCKFCNFIGSKKW